MPSSTTSSASAAQEARAPWSTGGKWPSAPAAAVEVPTNDLEPLSHDALQGVLQAFSSLASSLQSQYRQEKGARKAFAMFVRDVGEMLADIRPSLPAHAAEYVTVLYSHVRTAACQMDDCAGDSEPLLRKFADMHLLLPILFACMTPDASLFRSDRALAAVSDGKDKSTVTQASGMPSMLQHVHAPRATSAERPPMEHIRNATQLVSEISALHTRVVAAVKAAQKEAAQAQRSDLPKIVAACMDEQWELAADNELLAAALDHMVVSSQRFLDASADKPKAVKLPTGRHMNTTTEPAAALSDHPENVSEPHSEPETVEGNDQEQLLPEPDYDVSGVSGLQQLCQKMATATMNGKRLSLKQATVSLGPGSNAAVTRKWSHVQMWPHQASLSAGNIKKGLFSLENAPPASSVYVVEGAGTILQDGTLELGDSACLLFDSSCKDVHLQNIRISDGVVVCYGSGCQVTFTKVSFHNSTLVVINGAQATVCDSSMLQSTYTDDGLACFVSGASTAVNLNDTKVTGGAQGVVVRDRACLKVASSSFADMAITGIEVRGKESSLYLRQCTISNVGHREVHSWGDPEAAGCAVWDDSEATVDHLQLSMGAAGVLVQGNARVNMTNSTFCKTAESCMHVCEGSTATVKSCMFSESQMHGIFVRGDGSSVEAEGCKFFRNEQGGASAFAGGQVSAVRCETRGNQKAGFWAQMGAKLQAASCNSFNDAVGAGAGWQGTIVVSDSSMRDSRHAGLQVCGNSTAEFTRSSVSNSAGCGAIIEDSGSFAKVHGCTFDDCKIDGVHVSDQGRATVEDCTIRGSKKAHGVLATLKGSKITVKGCKLLHCKQNGVGAFNGALAEVFDSSSTGCQGGAYWAQSGGQLKLTGCTSEKDRVGINATDSSKVTASAVTVSSNKEYGVGITDGSRATMKACRVSKSEFVGVLAAGRGSALEMNDCVVSEPQSSCVQILDRGRVSMRECLCSKSRDAHGVACAQAGSTVTAMDCRFERNTGSGVFATQHSAAVAQSCQSKDNCGGGFWAQDGASVTLSKCYSEGGKRGCGASSGATLKAEHCRVKGNDIAGYLIESKAAGQLTSCDATSCRQRGVIVAGAGARLCMEGGTLADNRGHAVHVLHGAEAQMKKVKSSGHAIAGFVSMHQGSKLELWQCESTDDTPYACIKSGVMERVSCHPAGSGNSPKAALQSHIMEMVLSEMEDD